MVSGVRAIYWMKHLENDPAICFGIAILGKNHYAACISWYGDRDLQLLLTSPAVETDTSLTLKTEDGTVEFKLMTQELWESLQKAGLFPDLSWESVSKDGIYGCPLA